VLHVSCALEETSETYAMKKKAIGELREASRIIRKPYRWSIARNEYANSIACST